MRKVITNPDGSKTRISSSGRKFNYPRYGGGGDTKPYNQPSAEASKSFMDDWSGVTTTKDIKPTVTQAKADVPQRNINEEPLYIKPWNWNKPATGKIEESISPIDLIGTGIYKSLFNRGLSLFKKPSSIIKTPPGFQNKVFESNVQLGSFQGKGHLSQKGFNYRTLGEEELKAIQETKGVFPKIGKAKGGNSNVKYWTKGNEKNWYADNPTQQVIRVPETKFYINKVVDADDVEFFNHKLGKFQPIKIYKSPYKNAGKIKRFYKV